MTDKQFALLIRTLAYGFYCVVKTLTVAAMFQRDPNKTQWPKVGDDLEKDIRKACVGMSLRPPLPPEEPTND